MYSILWSPCAICVLNVHVGCYLLHRRTSCWMLGWIHFRRGALRNRASGVNGCNWCDGLHVRVLSLAQAVEFRNRLQVHASGVQIPNTLVLDHPTPAAIGLLESTNKYLYILLLLVYDNFCIAALCK